ncbi:MAG: carboxypeptidase-like regulatory domain-containing protein [Chitinophagales bacterium]|nr:TonB-dependent receptor [Chitinophagales bacterium]MDW8273880.1 carboxypeptidase-like regulatory domain-containing protein [Chitinophagales bacterium]
MLSPLFSKNITLLCICAVISFNTIAQQTAIVKGVIRTNDGKPAVASVVVQENQRFFTTSNEKGNYELIIPADDTITLVFSSINTVTKREKIYARKNAVLKLDVNLESKVGEIKEVEVIDQRKRQEASTTDINVRQSLLPTANESIEAFLSAQGLGVQRNNELSSAYSVRGGNFDENLVYVNDFEVYRPFLIRSGQQEGLSFANPNLVQNIRFTSGGFQARYGDKMSSVMDVTYKRPKKFGGSFSASLLGFGGHLEGVFDKKERFSFLVGVRQRLSQYLLRSLEVAGQYSPNFLDVQGFFYFQWSDKWSSEIISQFSRNRFDFKPVSRETTFGFITDVKRLNVYYEGMEADRYQTLMNGLSLIYQPNENLRLKILGSAYLSSEKEAFDILGQYFLSQVETDFSKENFGENIYSLGVGGIQGWARNELRSEIYVAAHRGSWFKGKHNVQWGIDYKREYIQDRLNEWDRLDSAGYSLPPFPFTTDGQTLRLNYVLKGRVELFSNRFSGFIQDTWRFGDSVKYSLNYGLRYSFWDLNKEWLTLCPRVQFSVKPATKADIIFNFSGGLYYQPPFYREMRNLKGEVNTSLRAQKSAHAVAGLNYAFTAWKRPFSFVTEVYYKYMWDLVPYDFNNVLIRYLGENSSKGYAAGIDLRLNGQLAEGDESWISLSFMKTAEDIANDRYMAYYDSTGREIPNTRTYGNQIRDSALVDVGYLPRPTDQRVNFALFFQDHIPKFKFIKVHISLLVGTGLPFSPPGSSRYRNALRIPPYRRLDIGFSGQVWNNEWAKRKNSFGAWLKGVWLSLEVWNVLGIPNTVSYIWVRDIANNQYAVPNYLTDRRINGRLIVNF